MIILPNRRKSFRSSGGGFDGSSTLALRWRMDEASGDCTDSHTSSDAPISGDTSNIGLLQNAPSRVAGKYGSALDLDGTNQYVKSQSYFVQGSGYATDLFISAGLSMGVWVKLDAYPSSGKYVIPAFIGRGDGSNRAILEFLLDSSGNVLLHFFNESTTAPITVPLNTWTHLMVVRNYSTKVHKIYVNGIYVHTYTVSTIINAGFGSVTTGNSLCGILFGYSSYLNGLVDDLRIYKTELAASDIASIYAGTDLQTP